MVDAINSVSTMPMPVRAKSVNSPQNNSIEKAIENNNKTTKLCAYVALGTSCATLLPLSILAIKTGKISKVAENFEKSAKPIMDDLGKASTTIKYAAIGASEDLKAISGLAKNKTSEIFDLLKSDDMKNLLQELQTKVKDVDTKPIVESITNSINELKNTLNGKLNDVNSEKVNELISSLKCKIDSINVGELSADTKKLFNSLIEKFRNVEVKPEA